MKCFTLDFLFKPKYLGETFVCFSGLLIRYSKPDLAEHTHYKYLAAFAEQGLLSGSQQ